MKTIRTDSDMVRIAKQIDAHLDAIRNILYDLEEAAHPGAKDFIHGLDSNGLTAFAWAEHIVHDALVHPERWETSHYGIRYKGRQADDRMLLSDPIPEVMSNKRGV